MLLQGPYTPPPTIPLDPNQLIPLLGMIGGLAIAGIFLWRFFTSDMASAIAERIRGRRKSVDPVDAGHVAELERQMADMHGQIAEIAERLDFAERLLAQQRERVLPGA